MSKHTPGPWKANTFMVVATKFGGMYGGKEVCHTGIVGDRDTDECEANSKLIAAAPAMYDLIEQFGTAVTNMFEQMTKCNWHDDLGHLAAMNATVIALKKPVQDAIDLRASIASTTT